MLDLHVTSDEGKMEKTEENEHNALRDVLSDKELTQIPEGIVKKLNAHFNEKFEQYITAKAVFETNKKNFGNLQTNFALFLVITVTRLFTQKS